MSRISEVMLPLAAGVLVTAPIGDADLTLALLLSLEISLALVFLRNWRAEPVAVQADPAAAEPEPVVGSSTTTLHLMRRTAPQLRARRPFGTVEAQVRWRQAASAARRRRQQGG